MITLQPITETNFLTAAALSVSPDQGRYVAPAPIILARAYAYRRHRASAWGVYDGCRMVGLALMEDCYILKDTETLPLGADILLTGRVERNKC